MKMLNVVNRDNSALYPRNQGKSGRRSVKETTTHHNNDEKQQHRTAHSESFSSSSSIFFHRSKARLRAEEEEKLSREQAERAEKLQKFQNEVQKRVSVMRKVRQQKEIEQGMKDMNIACNVMRSCVGFSTSIIDPQKFLVPLKRSPDGIPHNNSLESSQNQEILTTRSHDSNTDPQQHSLEERIALNSNSSANPYTGPKTIICHDKQSPNQNYLISGGKKDQMKLNKVLDNTCSGPCKNHIVSIVQPDQIELQEMKKQQTLQRTLSRKVFMDIEREKTREVERLHRQRMDLFLMRNTREAIRQAVEMSARDPVTKSEVGIIEDYVEEIPENVQKTEELSHKHSLLKASYARKSQALIKLLEEKCTKHGLPVPTICQCGTPSCGTPSCVTDPPFRNNCANNCQFYKNPAEYCRAIKCLISSMESSCKHPRPFLT